GDHRVAAGLNVGIEAATGVVQLHHLRLYHQPAALGHGVACVEAEIHQHLFDLRGVCLHRVELGVHKLEFDVFANHLIEKTDQSAGDGIEVHRTWLQYLAAGKGQQLAS